MFALNMTAIRECVPPEPGTLHLDWLLPGLRAEMERLADRLRVHLPIAVDEHGRIHPAGDAVSRLLAELLYLVTRYGWLYELPPVLAEATRPPSWGDQCGS
jgi:hypothetical protein